MVCHGFQIRQGCANRRLEVGIRHPATRSDLLPVISYIHDGVYPARMLDCLNGREGSVPDIFQGGLMFRKFRLTAEIMLVLLLTLITAAGQDVTPKSEDERSRLTKEEITILMIKVGRMPVPEQDGKMELIWKDPSGSQTPRSDFMFCTGLAYLGNYKAEAYLGFAYQNGRGIVEDLTEAYVWYSVALEHPIDDKATAERIRADRNHIKASLQSNYPAPSDDELEDLVKKQRDRMMQYLAEIRDTRL